MQKGIAPRGPAELKCKLLISQGTGAWDKIELRA
jgi:hypothetical protein